MRGRALALALAATIWATPAFAAEGLRVLDVDTSEPPQVRLDVSAPAARTTEALPDDAFSVSEDGQARQVQVSELPSDQLEIILVVDTAARDALAAVQAAAVGFFLRLPAGARVGLLDAGAPPQPVLAPTDSRTEVAAGVVDLQPREEAALLDGIVVAAGGFSPDARTRAVVAVQGPAELGGEASATAVRAALEASGAALYGVSMPRAGGGDGLAALAEGGWAEQADDALAIAEALEAIAADLRHRYRLTFVAEGQGMAEVHVRLETADLAEEATVAVDLASGGPPAAGDGAVAPPDLAAPPAGEGPTRASQDSLPWWGAFAATVTALLTVGLVALLLSKRTMPPAADRKPSAWETEAARVRGLVGGGDDETVRQLGERIAQDRARTIAEVAAASLPARAAVVALTAAPAGVAAIRFVVDPDALGRFLAGPVPLTALLVAAGLTAAGGWWLARTSLPPFSPWPAAWRAEEQVTAEEEQVIRVLDLAALYAACGIGFAQAVDEAARIRAC